MDIKIENAQTINKLASVVSSEYPNCKIQGNFLIVESNKLKYSIKSKSGNIFAVNLITPNIYNIIAVIPGAILIAVLGGMNVGLLVEFASGFATMTVLLLIIRAIYNSSKATQLDAFCKSVKNI